ncbi:glycosyltransferase family 2 protein [Sphingomonas sp. CFBP 13603]|uniref:glycosyltransferase family 2 protein n=1 Tax=Sphingomonas sp. CFBP 13603 TaxID=2774040 RepID=UPI00406CE6FD
MPCYYEAELIERTLQSLAHQAWQDFAMLISGDASTNATGEIGRVFFARDPCFHYYRQPANIDCSRNLNFVADHTASRSKLWMGHTTWSSST